MVMSVYEAINQAVYELIEQAEKLCGERVPGYTLHGVKFMDIEQPSIHIDGKDLVIYLTSKVREDFDEACCECAHEVIHLISPRSNGTETTSTVLEEGLATFFQALIYRDWSCKGFQTHNEEYDKAFTHVDRLLHLYPNAIKILRRQESELALIKEDLIMKVFPDLPDGLAKELEKPLSQLNKKFRLKSEGRQLCR